MTLQVFEHEVIRYTGFRQKEGFEKSHFLALCNFHDSKPDFKFYSIVRDGIKFNQHVGVIKVGSITIEILPKTDQSDSKAIWRDVLVQMLKESGELDVQSLSQASLRLRSNHILDLYFELFIQEAEYLLHTGLIKRYRKSEENGYALRGSLNFAKHIQRNVTHKERFYVNRQVYDINEPLNRIIRKTINLLPSLCLSNHLLNRANGLKLNFPELDDISVSEKLFSNIKWDRKNERYKTCIHIARLILLNYHPDITTGYNDVLAILFDMNTLWEKFIFKRLKKAVPQAVTIRSQESKHFWESKKIRPDIFMHLGDRKVILDTKWKLLRDGRPSDDDLKQMFTYNRYYNCNESILLYPSIGQKSTTGTYHHDKSCCRIEFIKVLEKDFITGQDVLSRGIGPEIFKLIKDRVENVKK
jgi:5-methylcytosine-specific restriction enzyme subunit McrC